MTEAQYFQKVDKIERLNRHHELLPKLKSRFSLVHAQYVDMILDQLLKAFSYDTEEVPVLTQRVVNQTVLQNRDDIFKSLLGKKYNIRTRLSVKINKFHDCTSDAERKDVSIAVNDIENELAALQKDIDYYERNGRMPLGEDDENSRAFFEIPGTIEGIDKRMNTVKVSIHNLEEKLAAFDFKIINDAMHPQHKKFQKMEATVKKWKELRVLLVNARKKLKDEV